MKTKILQAFFVVKGGCACQLSFADAISKRKSIISQVFPVGTDSLHSIRVNRFLVSRLLKKNRHGRTAAFSPDGPFPKFTVAGR